MIIGLHGKAGSGKDQSFLYIQEWANAQGLSVRREAFADRVKISAAKALGYEGTPEECITICNRLKQPGWNIVIVNPLGKPEHPLTGRQYIQLYGTVAHREVFGEDFWVDLVLSTYRPTEILVITDVRFPNEAEAVRAAGGEVWQIQRPGDRIAEDWHVSEQPLSHELIDYWITNDSDLDHLRDLVQARVEGVKEFSGTSS